MRTIIAGSRSITDYSALQDAMRESAWVPSVVICGRARGVDTLGEQWAAENNLPVEYFYPQWTLLGKRAGMVRNVEMAQVADALVALWDGKSRGTAHMIQTAARFGLVVAVFRQSGTPAK